MKNKHKIAGIVDKFYFIVAKSVLFWWVSIKYGLIYGLLDGIYALNSDGKLNLKKKQLVSFCQSIFIILTITSFFLISKSASYMSIVFIGLLITTSLGTIYLFEIANCANLKYQTYQEIYAQAFINTWRNFPVKICFLALGLLLLKLNLVVFIFFFPKLYQILLNKLNIRELKKI